MITSAMNRIDDSVYILNFCHFLVCECTFLNLYFRSSAVCVYTYILSNRSTVPIWT